MQEPAEQKEHPEHREHKAHRESRSGVDGIKRWLGVGAALLSTASACIGILRAESDMSARAQLVAEQISAGQLQQQAGDYSNAWQSFQTAGSAAAADGPIATLLGGSGKVQAQVSRAQQDLAMQWLRHAGMTAGPPYTELVDRTVPVLAPAVGSASGARKADLLAHIGWAYYLKQRSGDTGVDPLGSYTQAVAADAGNPYAQAFWGVYLLWNRGRPGQSEPVTEAQKHFAAALASGKEHALVRQLQLTSLAQGSSDEAEAAWWQTLAGMRKAGEPIDAASRRKMVMSYFTAPNSDHQVERLLALLPAAEHVELQRMLLHVGGLDAREILAVKANMAIALEVAGRPAEALAQWHEVKEGVQPDQQYNFSARMEAALKPAVVTPIRKKR